MSLRLSVSVSAKLRLHLWRKVLEGWKVHRSWPLGPRTRLKIALKRLIYRVAHVTASLQREKKIRLITYTSILNVSKNVKLATIRVLLSAITATSNNNLFVVLAMFWKKDLEHQMCFLRGRRWISLRRHSLKSFMYDRKGRSFTIWPLEMWSAPLETQINRTRYSHTLSYLYILVPNSWNGSMGEAGLRSKEFEFDPPPFLV